MYFIANNIHKTYNNFSVGFSIECEKNTITSILGPSGCGKSTILNIIAGLEENDKSHDLKLILDNKEIQNLPPQKREIGFVFQSGALFNHLNVVQNVSYGLISKGIKKKVALEQAKEYLSYFNLSGFESRFPQTLSGGEKQRVALARTLILSPKLVLLDEPFSALDTELKLQLQNQLKKWQQEIGFTCIMVTHDKEEAKNLSDKILTITF